VLWTQYRLEIWGLFATALLVFADAKRLTTPAHMMNKARRITLALDMMCRDWDHGQE
jgi:hypothetical protein